MVCYILHDDLFLYLPLSNGPFSMCVACAHFHVIRNFIVITEILPLLPMCRKWPLASRCSFNVVHGVRTEAVAVAKVDKPFLGYEARELGNNYRSFRDLITGTDIAPETSIIFNQVT
jgi:hypothetical protein